MTTIGKRQVQAGKVTLVTNGVVTIEAEGHKWENCPIVDPNYEEPGPVEKVAEVVLTALGASDSFHEPWFGPESNENSLFVEVSTSAGEEIEVWFSMDQVRGTN